MGRLVYSMNLSLDGYVETPDHSLDWTNITEEVHCWFTDRLRETGLIVYGRRLYETMAAFWPTAEADPNIPGYMLDFSRTWNPKPKMVVSSTLREVGPNCRLVRTDPVEEVLRVRDDVEGDLEIAGPTLARAFVERNLIDRYDLVVHPVVLGAGLPFFPTLQSPLHLRLVATHTFDNGAVHQGYEPVRD